MNRFRRWLFFLLLCTVPSLNARVIPPPPDPQDQADAIVEIPSGDPTPELTVVPTSDDYLMDEVVVTSDRLPTPKDQVAGSISVLTASDLEIEQRTTVADALREIPGVDVVQDGGVGKVTSLSLRGSGSERTLVFVDGVEVNDPMSTGGSYDFGNLTTDNVERIEVLRGSQSALYGPDATGGVVQIFTKQGQGRLKSALTGEAGSMGYLRSALGLMGGDSWLDYSIQVSHLREDGFSVAAANPTHILPLENDGTQNTVVSSKFGSKPVSFLTLRLIQRYTESKTAIDNGAFDDDPNHLNLTRESILKGEAETDLWDGHWIQTISFSQSLQHFTDLNDPDLDHPNALTRNFFNGRREQMEWKNDFHLVPHHTFSVGFENRQEWGDDSNYSEYPDAWTGTVDSYASSFTKRTDRVNGWYLQDQASYGKRFFLSSGARWDRNDLYGGRATWRLAPAYLLPVVRTKLKTTLGTGWKTPTLYQRFSEYGNPNLLPERSLSWDAGFEQPFFGDKMRLNAVYFDNRYKNYLDFDNLAFVYLNIPRVRTRGAETSLDGHLYRDSLVQLTFNRTDAKNQDTGEKLLRRAFERSSFRLDSPTFHGTRAGFEVLYTGRRQDLVFPADWSPAYQITLPDYTLVRLHADWKPSKRITVFGRIENLFNRRYQEVLGYQTSLRAFYAGTTLDL